MGGHGEYSSTGLLAGDWQLAADYRYFHTDQAFFGTERDTQSRPLIIDLQSVNLNATYAVTDRMSVRLTVPVSHGSQSRLYGDSIRHVVRAGGIGDVSVVASTWLANPLTHLAANLAVGVGLKAPTARYEIQRPYYLPDSSSVPFGVDQSVEPGDGGWGIILQGQAFARITRRLYAYFTGAYLLTPGDQTDATRAPAGQKNSDVHYSVADVYTGRLGVSYSLSHGLSMSLGGRVDGIPYHDLIGKSHGFRRPAFVALVDPGVTLERGQSSIAIGIPVRVAQRLATRTMVQGSHGTIGGGDLAKVLFFVSYARRF